MLWEYEMPNPFHSQTLPLLVTREGLIFKGKEEHPRISKRCTLRTVSYRWTRKSQCLSSCGCCWQEPRSKLDFRTSTFSQPGTSYYGTDSICVTRFELKTILVIIQHDHRKKTVSNLQRSSSSSNFSQAPTLSDPGVLNHPGLMNELLAYSRWRCMNHNESRCLKCFVQHGKW